MSHQAACRLERPRKTLSGGSRCPLVGRDVRTRTSRLPYHAALVWYDRSVMVKGFSRAALVFGLAVFSIAVPGAQNRPLPDPEAFLKETRKHLQTDSAITSSYMYVETR